ncbi:MAG: response regulator [Halioglobus sp.]
MNVLLVEDDPQVADFIVGELEAAGHTCVHAGDGHAGQQAAITAAFDVMVIDRMMPRMDGLALIKALRDSGDQTPVLVLSALGDVDDRVQGLHSGADDYLVKPLPWPSCSHGWMSCIAARRRQARIRRRGWWWRI